MVGRTKHLLFSGGDAYRMSGSHGVAWIGGDLKAHPIPHPPTGFMCVCIPYLC